MIRELLNLLPPTSRQQLMCAFEQNIEQIINLEDGTFLGVNVLRRDKVEVLEEEGRFIHGRRAKMRSLQNG